ncbi:MAG: anion permease, partial [Bryobacteraceae bacterium]
PGLRDTQAARIHAQRELKTMGRFTGRERRLVVIMFAVMAGWISSPWHHVPNAFVALGGVTAILVSRVLAWNDLLGERKAWDALILLVLAYLYIHYGFASMTAQITALYPGFLTAALVSGASPLLAALALAFFSNLNAGLTHYGTGAAPVYFGVGYVKQTVWWKIGLLMP